MYHWLFRREKLCPGSASCGEAQNQTQGEDPCVECPSVKLDEFLANTPRGQMLHAAVRIDRMRQAGITFGPQDLTYPEALLLDLLNETRDAFTDEQMKEATRKR